MLRTTLTTSVCALALALTPISPASAQTTAYVPDAGLSFPSPLAQPVAGAPSDSVLAPEHRRKRWYEGNLLRAVAVPAVLIGYGFTVRGDNGFYSSEDARRDIRRQFGDFRTGIDDFMLVVPYAELAALALFKVPERHDRINTSLLVLKSTAISATLFSILKYSTKEPRPDRSNNLSFPSGHTAIAFTAASLVHQEFRARSQWPGIGAYAVATSVGALRMINDRHWQADVLVGAGIGILSVHAAYLTHRYRWGRRPEEGPGSRPPKVGRANLSPWAWPGRGTGLTLTVPLR